VVIDEIAQALESGAAGARKTVRGFSGVSSFASR